MKSSFSLLLPLVIVVTSMSVSRAEAAVGAYLSCATPDQTIQLRSEVKARFGEDEAAATEHIELKIQSKVKTGSHSANLQDAKQSKAIAQPYVEGDQHRVLYFSNGETVVREFSTGQTVLTFKQVPLLREDRGFEKRIVISQSRFLKAPTYLQCRTVLPEKNKMLAGTTAKVVR